MTRQFNWLVVAIVVLTLAVYGCQQESSTEPDIDGRLNPNISKSDAEDDVAENQRVRPLPENNEGPAHTITPSDGLSTPVTPTPTAQSTPPPTPYLHPVDPCGPSYAYHYSDYYANFLHWTGDGSRLVFNIDDTLWVFDIEDSESRKLVDADADYMTFGESGYRFLYGFHADVSPDGSRIVYSSCEYMLPRPLPVPEKYPTRIVHSEGYEIVSVNIDGTDRQRMTNNEHLDHYPVWSPDGTKIAFMGNRHGYEDTSHYSGVPAKQTMMRLAVIPADAQSSQGDEAVTYVTGGRVALYPPVWSPDGNHLAFIKYEGDVNSGKFYVVGEGPHKHILHTIRTDSTAQTRIGEIAALPTWSPDSERLAFVLVDEESPGLYTARPDGTDLRLVWASETDDASTAISLVSWSPDGSEILLLSPDGMYALSPDSKELRTITDSGHSRYARAVWSPDGGKIAVFSGGEISIITQDGTEERLIGEVTNDGSFSVRKPPPPVDIGACSAGVVVPQPEANPGLVQDCEVLLGMRNTLVRHGPLIINWNEETPLSEWAGVVIDGSPPRVHELELWRGGLKGSLPPEIGQLTELRVIDIRGGSGDDANELQGPLPKELGDLTNLDKLVIGRHALSGPIPPELGKLKNLTWLELYGNHLSGSIPPELAQMESLKGLVLTLNNLRGNIPVELGQLQELNYLRLDGNEFSGSIPVELAELVRLRTLHLNDNNLGGEIPVELAQMQSLDDLKLEGNDFSGCIAKEFTELWLQASWLPRCEPEATPTPQATPTP